MSVPKYAIALTLWGRWPAGQPAHYLPSLSVDPTQARPFPTPEAAEASRLAHGRSAGLLRVVALLPTGTATTDDRHEDR
jgi:hypothetical protein